ncbi:MAG TPA: leucyl/phenylalanyl-tRNA--protein transferase [Bdellovibrionota bacterium]|nr:leucyl/phenylalanyl-tRNA--protein transferase [Bdellovibrionota bacterium]
MRGRFPDPRSADADGLVALGGDLEPGTLLEAYRSGIFPWPVEDFPILTWFSPDPRGVIFPSELHVPRSLFRALRREPYRYTVDRAFGQVIRGCASVARKPLGTWLTPQMIGAYVRLHELGHAHSVEVWRGDELVAGIYGIGTDRVFSAESMFRREDDASKAALVYLVEHAGEAGYELVDVQVMSSHVAALGGREIPREEYLRILGYASSSERSPRKR